MGREVKYAQELQTVMDRALGRLGEASVPARPGVRNARLSPA